VQEVPAARVEPQLFVWAKPALVEIPEIVTAAVPLLVSVSGRGWLVVFTTWLPKFKLFGENVTSGDVPLPVRETVCGLPAASSLTESVPFALPTVSGVKVTLIVQELPAARVEPQLFVSEKLALAEIPEIVSTAVPLLVSVTGRGWLGVFTTWLPNAKLVGERPIPGDVPVPLRETTCGFPAASSVTDSVPFAVPAACGVNVTLIVQEFFAVKLEPQLFV
jgi:hypothetical protein